VGLWLPLGLFILWRYYAHKTNVGELTPERQAVYSMAMSFEQNPERLTALADAFKSAGLFEQARALRNRAKLPTLPANVQLARAQALKAALSSTDPVAIRGLALVFESQGAGASAGILRDYAQGLEQSLAIPPVQMTPQNPPAPHPQDQQRPPEAQAPATQAGQMMEAPVPLEAIPAPVPPMPDLRSAPMPHGEGFGGAPTASGDFGVGTVIPSQYPHPTPPPPPPPDDGSY
jgi:hypothetical protein